MILKVVKEEQRTAYLLVQKSKPILMSGQAMQSKFILWIHAHFKSTILLKEQHMFINI